MATAPIPFEMDPSMMENGNGASIMGTGHVPGVMDVSIPENGSMARPKGKALKRDPMEVFDILDYGKMTSRCEKKKQHH